MDKIKVIHDVVSHTLTVWLDDPAKEHVSEETTDEVVLMKDAEGRVISFELLHYRPSTEKGLAVETVVQLPADSALACRTLVEGAVGGFGNRGTRFSFLEGRIPPKFSL